MTDDGAARPKRPSSAAGWPRAKRSTTSWSKPSPSAAKAGRRFLGLRHYDVQLHRRHDPARRQHRRNGHRRRQDARRHAARLPQRAAIVTTTTTATRGSVHVVTVNDYLARRDMEWMGPLYTGPRPHRRRDPERHGLRRAAEGLRLRHHLRHEQRVRLRLPPRQHADRRPRRRPLSEAPAAGPGPAALRDHRRSRQHPHRRSPHAADHLRPGRRRRHQVRSGPTRSPGSSRRTSTSRSRKKSTPPTSPTKASARPSGWPASRASTRPATWSGRT